MTGRGALLHNERLSVLISGMKIELGAPRYGYVRCPRCEWLHPKKEMDPITGLCHECTLECGLQNADE